MFETLEVDANEGIGHLWLNRPDKLNALSGQALRELVAAAQWFNEQGEVRVVIIGGRGSSFSAGADISAFPTVGTPDARQAADAGRVMAESIENMHAIAIARIHGWCVGGALVLAAACDLRVATENAKFSIPEVDLGIPLAWGGIPRLVREIGPALTKELVATCREFHAAEALSAGFLNRVVATDELDATITTLAKEIAKRPKTPVAVTKRHVNAVTSQMVGDMRSWSDADSLIAAIVDPECMQARKQYMSARGHGKASD